ncbi:hypothetical protein BDFB_004019 [Asbolus verrucosus]|uniref:Uncharacterized protein n=1 Tax=Asbolus verrucosus TaxID=1661398 RepID=A0A482VJN0_ASBVE|nr:hypothetical protein BDFB_004019 [Asbolus verrucosus]
MVMSGRVAKKQVQKVKGTRGAVTPLQQRFSIWHGGHSVCSSSLQRRLQDDVEPASQPS